MGNPVRQRAIEGLAPGVTFTVSRTFSEVDTRAFGDLTRDYNPVHYDSSWIREKALDGRICHGLLVGSMICQVGGQLGWLATGMSFRFVKPVYFGDTICCRFTITRVEDSGRAEAEAVFTNQSNLQVGVASLSGRVPVGNERLLLQQLVDAGDPDNPLARGEAGPAGEQSLAQSDTGGKG